MKSVFAYIRVSTAKQGEHGSSLQEQKAAIEAYAKKHGLFVSQWFEERETAAKQGRPTFQKMLSLLKRGDATGIIIHKIDRGARNLRDWANLGDLIDHGIDVHFAHESLDLKSRGGRLAADIQAVVAADFIRNLREETRKGFYGRLKQGLYPLSAPLGYRDCGGGKPKELDPITAPLVRDAFTLYATGEFTFEELRAELYKSGLRNQAGGCLSKNGLSIILNNPFYMGLIHIRKTNETFAGVHKPLITKALYDRVQHVLAGNRQGKTQVHDHVFRRLIRCGTCGCSLVGETQKRKYVYYRCHSYKCSVSIRSSTIDRLLQEVFGLIKLDEREFRDLREIAEEHKRTSAQEAKQRKAALELQLAKCKERIVRLTDALLDGLIDKELFESRKREVLAAQKELEEKLAIGDEFDSATDRVSQYLELTNTAYLSYKNGLPSEKRAVVRSLTSNFVAHGKNPVITLNSPFQEIAEYRKSQASDPRRDRPRTFARKVFEIITCTVQSANDNEVVANMRHNWPAVYP